MTAPQVYYENQATRFLNIGDVVFLSKSAKIVTTLGSCVSICLFSPMSRVVAVCHAQMPARKMIDRTCFSSCPVGCRKGIACEQDNKYVESVLPFMLREFDRKAIPRSSIQAIVTGGSSMLPALRTINQIGFSNTDLANNLLNENRIRIVFQDTGGDTSRKLEIDNDNGIVMVNKKMVFRMWDKPSTQILKATNKF